MKLFDVLVCLGLAALVTPALSMKLGQRQEPSTTTTDSTAAAAPSSSSSSSGTGGGPIDCAGLESKHEYFLAQVAELQGQNIAVPAYLAGYASAAADTLETLGCSGSSAGKGTSGAAP